MAPRNFQEECMEVVREYTYSSYCNVPKNFQPLLEATILHKLLSTTFQLDEQANIEYLRGYLYRNNQDRTIFLECWEKCEFDRLLDLEISRAINHPSSQRPPSNVIIHGGVFKEIHGDNYEITIGENDHAIMNWLCPVDQRQIQRDTYKRRSKDTANWFLDSSEFVQWVSESESRILWCPGIPGAGKTVIASAVINYLQRLRGCYVLFVYFDYKRQRHETLASVLGSLTRQLYECFPSHREALKEAHDNSKDENPSEDKLRDLLKKVILRQDTKLFFVLDALDEYLENYTDAAAFSLLDQLMILLEDAKVMVTSRALGRMEAIFKSQNAIRLEVLGNNDDLERYIRNRIQKAIPFAQRILDDIVEAVIGVAQHRFLSVKLHMDNLCSMLTIGEIRDALPKLSSNIDDAYTLAMERIEAQRKPRKDLAHRALTWIALCSRPLTERQLQAALASAPGRTNLEDYMIPGDSITGVCGGLIVSESQNSAVRFIHMTVHEYFQKNPEKLEFGHLHLARVCINHIHTTLSTEDLLAGLLADLKCRWPGTSFAVYALSSWGFHGSKCDDMIHEEIAAFLCSISDIIASLQHKLRKNEFFDLKTRIFRCKGTGTPIHVAAFFDMPKTISLLVQRGISINAQTNDTKYTPLALAVAKKSTPSLVRHLLSIPGTDVNLPNDAGRGPLAIAVRKGFAELVNILLQHNADIYAKDQKGWTPLIWAANSGATSGWDIAILKNLLEIGAGRGDSGIHSALAAAARRNWEQAVEILLQAGGDPMKADNTNIVSSDHMVDNTSVLSRIYELHPDAARLPGTERLPPIFLATSYGYVATVKLLLRTGLVSPLEKDHEGRSVLSYALKMRRTDVATIVFAFILNQNGSYIESIDSEGRTELSRAVEAGLLSFVETLISTGSVDINCTDAHGRSPIFYTSSLSPPEGTWTEIADYLIKHGASVNEVDSAGRSPLSYAAERGDCNLFSTLLENGAMIDEIDKGGRTPISYAAEVDNFEIARILLKHEANPELADFQGLDAIGYSCGRSQTLLRTHKSKRKAKELLGRYSSCTRN